jgi:hypothetical protein
MCTVSRLATFVAAFLQVQTLETVCALNKYSYRINIDTSAYLPTRERSHSNPTVSTLFAYRYLSCSEDRSNPYSAYRYGGCIQGLQPVPLTPNKFTQLRTNSI